MRDEAAFLNFFARLPIDGERHFIPKSGIFAQTPKWYQFKARSLLSEDNTWLGCLGKEIGFHRKRLILADEGGVGKTKSAALCANYLLNAGRNRPILILVEPRQRQSWFHKLRRVLPRHQRIHWKGSALSQLKHPLDSTVYVCSKYSLHRHIDELERTWRANETRFDLVVIDECHKNKPQRETDDDYPEDQWADGQDDKEASDRNFGAERKVCTFADHALGITASPLGIQPSDVWFIGAKIGVPEAHRSFFKPENRPKLGDPKNDSSAWHKWAKLNDGGGFRSCLEDFFQSPEKIDEAAWTSFVTTYGKPLAELLPIVDAEVFIHALKSFDFKDEGALFELLGELNPFSPFMSITLRADLGDEANEVFRTMRVRTIDAPFSEEALDQLHEWHQTKQKYEAKRMHSHPREAYQKPASGDLKFFESDVFDPRIDHLVRLIESSCKNKSEGSERSGMVVFVEYLDTVKYLKEALEKAWTKESIEEKPRLVIQRITGATGEDEAKAYLHDDGTKFSFASSATEYHVVIGTSAIEQGVDMPWADTVVHWDLHPNPRRLEQRTWRLDRHKEPEYSDVFDVVYFWTGFEGLKQQIERMHERIILYDQMLGRPFEANLWPCMKGQGPVERMYKGESKSFIHRESTSLAEAWHTTIQTEQGLAERQQISLFHWVALRTGSALSAEAVATGQLKLEDVEASIHGIRKLALYAEGHDREALAEFSMRDNHRPDSGHWLGANGFEAPPGKRRVRTVMLNPRGSFVSNMLRQHPSDEHLVAPSHEGVERVVFSIDPVKHEELFPPLRTLSTIAEQFLRDHSACELHHLSDGDDTPQTLSMEDEVMLLRLIEGLEQAGAPTSGPMTPPESVDAYKQEWFQKIKISLEDEYQTNEERLQEVRQAVVELQDDGIQSSDEERRLIRLQRVQQGLEARGERIAMCFDRELKTHENYTVNVRLHEVSA